MKNIHIQNLKVLSSQIDTNKEMGVLQSFAIAQDNMCEFFKNMDCDGPTMIPTTNNFFVMLKNKIHFNNFLVWLDNFTVRTDLVYMSRIRLGVQTQFIDKNQSVVAVCLQEMCPMDVTSRSVKMITDTTLPIDIEITDQAQLQFGKMTFDLSKNKCVSERVIDVTNIDIYKHTNNLEYVRFMLATLDLNFIENNTITDFEIYYICESKFGDSLQIFKMELDDEIQFQINKNDKVISKAVLRYSNRRNGSYCN